MIEAVKPTEGHQAAPFNWVLPLPHFSHIYVEHGAARHPIGRLILERFSRATVVPIKHYKEVFNRPRQNFRAQKRSMKLILAERRGQFLYSGSQATPSFGHRRFFYNTLAMNCLFDCSYCYLQGLYPSANLVLFVNIEDYLQAAHAEISARGPIYLCISYDTDLLALENIVPYCAHWIDFARKHHDSLIELRTKSCNIAQLLKHESCSNFILAWTLSPESVSRQIERLTPGLNSRISAMRQAIDAGWTVRICVDPILAVENWQEIYCEFLDQVFDQLPNDRIHDVSLGALRLPQSHYKRMMSQPINNGLIFDALQKRAKCYTYGQELERQVLSHLQLCFEKYLPSDKIFLFRADTTD